MSTEHPVFDCERQLIAAQLASDVAALDRLLADDLIYTGFDGMTGGKADDLGLHRSGKFRITRMDMIEREMRDLGDVAIVIVLMDTAALFEQTPMSKKLRYTRVWARKDGAWRLAAAHLGEVQA